jgi:hypothetical protein
MDNAAGKNDLAKTKAFFMEITRPERAIAFESLPEREALLKHPELVGTYAQKFHGRSALELLSRLDEGSVASGASSQASAIVLRESATFHQASLAENSKIPSSATAKIVAKTEHHVLVTFIKEKASVIVNNQAMGGKLEVGDTLRIDFGRDKNLAPQSQPDRVIGKTMSPILSIQKV